MERREVGLAPDLQSEREHHLPNQSPCDQEPLSSARLHIWQARPLLTAAASSSSWWREEEDVLVVLQIAYLGGMQ